MLTKPKTKMTLEQSATFYLLQRVQREYPQMVHMSEFSMFCKHAPWIGYTPVPIEKDAIDLYIMAQLNFLKEQEEAFKKTMKRREAALLAARNALTEARRVLSGVLLDKEV